MIWWVLRGGFLERPVRVLRAPFLEQWGPTWVSFGIGFGVVRCSFGCPLDHGWGSLIVRGASFASLRNSCEMVWISFWYVFQCRLAVFWIVWVGAFFCAVAGLPQARKNSNSHSSHKRGLWAMWSGSFKSIDHIQIFPHSF